VVQKHREEDDGFGESPIIMKNSANASVELEEDAEDDTAAPSVHASHKGRHF
jgi:hypothetical protein